MILNSYRVTLILIVGLLLPVLAVAQSQYNIYYGDIHAHTWYSDGSQDQNKATYTNPVSKAITFAKTNANSMNFLGLSEHNHSQAGMSQSNWNAAKSEAASTNQDGVFVGMVGQEWGVISGGGHVLVYGTDKLFGWESGVYEVYVPKNAYTTLWDSVAKYGGFCYLAHPQSGDYSSIFTTAYNAMADSVISGIAVKSGPSTSTNTAELDPTNSNYEPKYHDMLRLGYHVAPCGNQDNHNTTFGRANEQRTAVLATSLTQAGILDGLRKRHAYCTEDHNLQVRVECGTNIQGDIVSASGTPNIRVKVTDPDGSTVTSIQLRSGVPGSGTAPTAISTTGSGVDSLIYTTSQSVGATQYYYAYVTMSTGKHAWSAPIWLTRTSGSAPSSFTLTSPASGSTAQALAGTLQWAAASGATGYDVYLSTTNPPTTVVSTNQAGTSYNYSGLNTNATYYWKVAAKNGSGSTDATASPWNFATVKPTFSVSGSSVAFGSVTIGLNKRDSVTVTNTGTSTLSIDSVRSDNARFTITGGAASLAPSATQKYYFTFTPTVTTTQNGNIRFYHNATGSPATVTVSGSGIQLTLTATTHAGGTISPSGTVNISSGGSQQFTMTPSTGYHVDSVLVDGANAGAVTTYTFSGVTANHTISAYFNINHYSISSSAGSNGTISPIGITSVNYGDSVTYTMTAIPTFFISDVVVDGQSVGPVSTYKFRTVSANHSIVASFGAPGTYTITSLAGAHGTITPNGATSVTQNTDQAFTIAAAPGYHIDSVFVDGSLVGTPASYNFTNVIANHTIRAVFAATTYSISVSSNAGGTTTPGSSFVVNEGADTSVQFTPASGYVIDSVFVDGGYTGNASSVSFTNVTANHSVSVKFRQLTYTLTTATTGSGTITPAGPLTLPYGTDTTFAVTPATGYHLDSLIVDGLVVAPATSYSFHTIVANHTITAYFSINMYTLSASSGSNGAISPAGSFQLPYGSDTTFTFTPDAGYSVTSLLVDGIVQPVANSYTITGLSANHTIAVSFSLNEYVLAVTIVGGGSVARNPEQDTYQHGTEVGLTATAFHGYRFAGWSVDVNSLLGGVMVLMDGTKRVTATFEGIPFIEAGSDQVSFPPVAIGGEDMRTVVIRNTGGAALHISSITNSNDAFTVTPPSATIPAFDSLTVQILFAPGTTGPVSDTITVAHDADGGPITIALSGSGANLQRSVSNSARWNLISNPLITAIDNVFGLFPGSSYSYGYSFNGSAYVPEIHLRKGAGYWAKFANAGTSTISGAPIEADTISVTTGWNLIGSISNSIPFSAVQATGTSILSAAYGYASGYSVSDSILPGKAYWVRVSADGDLLLSNGLFSKAPSKTVHEASAFSGMTSIAVSDAAGSNQTLYLDASGNTAAVNRYSLPPVPPSGIFDARFSSQSQVEELNTRAAKQQFRVDLSSATYPVSVKIDPTAAADQQMIVTDANGKVLLTSKPGAGGEVTISNAETESFTVAFVTMPKEFSLQQNYPNPFNPSSHIQFELPVDSRVTLKVYDVLGREVQSILTGEVQDAGFHQAEFNGANLGSGVYFYRIEATPVSGTGKSFSKVLKMALVK